jgi:DNA-directed RNA polymerase specialized sigma subunit
MNGKDYLKRIKKVDTQIKNKNFELKQLKESQLPTAAIYEELTKLYDEKRNIIKQIEKLPEAEYDVLHKIYVQGETLQEVAADRGISRRKVDGLHGRALLRLESIINPNN